MVVSTNGEAILTASQGSTKPVAGRARKYQSSSNRRRSQSRKRVKSKLFSPIWYPFLLSPQANTGESSEEYEEIRIPDDNSANPDEDEPDSDDGLVDGIL